MHITDRQATFHLQSDQEKYRFFFEKSDLDTVKIYHEGKKSYLHFFGGEVEEYATKKALRRELSRESGGAWVEEKEGKKRYFVEEKGWLWNSINEVSKEEFLQKKEGTATLQKTVGIGLGILSFLPGAFEVLERLPFGAKESGMALLAMHHKSPLLGVFGCFLRQSLVDAQAVGLEFQVNNYTLGDQKDPTIAALNDGGFVVAWAADNQADGTEGIYAKRYHASGAHLGSEFLVNNYTQNIQRGPIVAALLYGGFVIAWVSDGQDGALDGIFAQRYDVNGSVIGPEFQVNSHTPNNQLGPAIAALNDSGFVVTWFSDGQDGDSFGIYAQRYDANGGPVGTEFRVNSNTANSQRRPAIASLDDGGFVISWESHSQDGDVFGIFARRYDVNVTAMGTEFQVNSYATNNQIFSDIKNLEDGGFLIAWDSDGQDGDSRGIYAQRYGATADLVGTEFRVNNYRTNSQRLAAIAAMKDGGFVITWESHSQDGDVFGIFARRYDFSGTPLGLDFQVNTYTTSFQTSAAIATLQDGDFVIVWESDGQDGNGYGIFGQRYDVNGSAIPLIAFTTTDRVETGESRFNTSLLFPSSTQAYFGTTFTEESSQIPISSSSDFPTTQGQSTASQGGPAIPSLIAVRYDENYDLTLNGVIIGTYYVTGGQGLFNADNLNTLVIEFNGNYSPSDGEIVLLFADVPQDQVLEWDNVEFVGGGECFTSEGVFIEETADDSYGLLFETRSSDCELAIEASRLAPLAALLASN